MKKFIFAAAVSASCLISTWAFAASSITDMLYLPQEGSVYIEPSYSYLSTKGDIEGGGITFATMESVENSIDLAIGYGISPNLALGLEVSYLIGGTDTTTFSSDFLAMMPPGFPKEEESKSAGVSDPNVFAKFRALDEDIIIDVTVGFSPGLSEAKDADSENDGNNVRGGHLAHAEIELAKKMEALTLGAIVSYDYYFDRESVDQESDVKTEASGGNELFFAIMGQYNIDPILIQLGLGYGMTDDEEYDTEGTVTESEGMTIYIGLINLGYVAVPDQVLINLGYTYAKAKDFEPEEGMTFTGLAMQEISLGARLLF